MASFNTYSSKTNKFTTKTFSRETARVNGETGPVFLLSDEENIFLVNITDDVFPVAVIAEAIAIEWSLIISKNQPLWGVFIYLMQVSSQQRYQTGRRKSIHWPRKSQITVRLRDL